MATNPSPQVPWFSGLCLQGGLAGQYLLEKEAGDPSASPPAQNQAPGNQAELELDGLAPITIFVGANNSGKSRLMRWLFCTEKFFRFKLSATDLDDRPIDPSQAIYEATRYLGNKPFWHKKSWVLHDKYAKNYIDINEFNGTLEALRSPFGDDDLLLNLRKNGLIDGIRYPIEIRRCYVPMLRGMRPPLESGPSVPESRTSKNRDFYFGRTIHDYFRSAGTFSPGCWGSEQSQKIMVFTGLGLYEDLRRRLLARTQDMRDTVRKYEDYLSFNFFGGKPVTLVPVEEDGNDVVHIRIGDKDDYPIHQLGDGMQSLIICTYPIIMETTPGCLFFLEEPDLGMHPSLQRSFVQVLKDSHRTMRHQFFLTTHSNHMLDLLEDDALVSIFSFSEIEKPTSALDQPVREHGQNEGASDPSPRFRIRPTAMRDRHALVELGVRPSATYLANATIWVEGISECAYLRAYMEAFLHYLAERGDGWGKGLSDSLWRYKEDRHYAFVEYNGSNIVHFSFHDGSASEASTHVPSLCARAIVLADRDIEDKGSGNREEIFLGQLGNRFVKLPGKEIENLIPVELMKLQVREDEKRATEANKDVMQNDIEAMLCSVSYCDYAWSEQGIGLYLDGKGFSKYQGSTQSKRGSSTLPGHLKSRWRNDSEGIPEKVRVAIRSEQRSQPELGSVTDPQGQQQPISPPPALLPDYLTQDIIWLCVVLYSHVAAANYDREAEKKLTNFKDWIVQRASSQRPPVDDDPPQQAHNPPQPSTFQPSHPPTWPLGLKPVQPTDGNPTPADRECLLTLFLGTPNETLESPSPLVPED